MIIELVALIAFAGASVVTVRRVRQLRGKPAVAASGALTDWDELAREYISHTDALRWAERWQEPISATSKLWFRPHANLRRLAWIANHLKTASDTANREFTIRRVEEDSSWFDTVLGRPLADCQRLAIVGNEDNMLVLAGAGSGKTLTIVAKILYLLHHRLAKPAEILAVTYNKRAQEELAERLDRTQADGIQVQTFHALGLRILRDSLAKQPVISRWVEQPELRKRFIRDRMAARLADEKSSASIQLLLTQGVAESDTRPVSLDAAISQLRSAGRMSLGGVKHKSLAEIAIANWLTLSGIAWEYEFEYPHRPERRKYKPDFWITSTDVYIEHFGIDDKGQTAPWIDGIRYRAEMEWKRAWHKQHGTILIETFGYEVQTQTLFTKLEGALAAHGIRRRNLTKAEIDAHLDKEKGAFSRLASALDRAISLVRGNVSDRASLPERCHNSRDRAFLELTTWLLGEYESEMAAHGEIDFDDMIGEATTQVLQGAWASPWKYIIVDEFQDISVTRLNLLKALRAQHPNTRIYAVGDDWQSIYAFAGSNVALLRNLSDHLGEVLRKELDLTYRFNQGLVDVACRFVQENPVQLKRKVKSRVQHDGQAPVCVRLHDGNAVEKEIDAALAEIAEGAKKPASVFLLGRYNFSQPNEFQQLQTRWESKGLNITFQTVHKTKGLEADYVIVFGLEQGMYGFPSGVEDDPSLHVVLPDAEKFAHAEERRLFYVALTRARFKVYVLGPAHAPSPFLDELKAYAATEVMWVEDNVKGLSCPDCQRKSVLKKSGQYGEFWACARFPLCEGKLPTCPSCGQGPVAKSESGKQACTACEVEQRMCPRCKVGILLKRNGQRGPFYGCSAWRPQDPDSCKYTTAAT